MDELLKIEDLSVSIHTAVGKVQAVRELSLKVQPAEVLAIVGESGCGKSILCRSIMRLLPKGAQIESGHIWVNGTDITAASERQMRGLRGKLFSMILQDPLTALDPTVPVGRQIAEAIVLHAPGCPRKALATRVGELLELVGLGSLHAAFDRYPHELSGGQRQRIVMAIALASEPKLLLADEPTTALDVTVQAQILDLLKELQRKLSTATVLISHDLAAVARVADRVAIMYAGRIVEIGTVEEIFYEPCHPYTWGLLRSLPMLDQDTKRLWTIPGMPPSMIDLPAGDAFAPRNEYALQIDRLRQPPMFRISKTHYAASWLLDPRAPKLTPPIGGKRYE